LSVSLSRFFVRRFESVDHGKGCCQIQRNARPMRPDNSSACCVEQPRRLRLRATFIHRSAVGGWRCGKLCAQPSASVSRNGRGNMMMFSSLNGGLAEGDPEAARIYART
jgi:hypothetical protein